MLYSESSFSRIACHTNNHRASICEDFNIKYFFVNNRTICKGSFKIMCLIPGMLTIIIQCCNQKPEIFTPASSFFYQYTLFIKSVYPINIPSNCQYVVCTLPPLMLTPYWSLALATVLCIESLVLGYKDMVIHLSLVQRHHRHLLPHCHDIASAYNIE